MEALPMVMLRGQFALGCPYTGRTKSTPTRRIQIVHRFIPLPP
jgi:hypothetical protein